MVTGPGDKALVMEPHSMDGLHGLDVKATGEYEICLDNSFSRMTGNDGLFTACKGYRNSYRFHISLPIIQK